MKYREQIELTEQALDLLNIKAFLIHGEELEDIYKAIQWYIDDNDTEEVHKVRRFMDGYDDFFHGDIFNWMTSDEFIEYCIKRYPEIRWGHEIVERFWVINRGDSTNA